ncbi:MAG: twin-arginine translocase TatA/TatE family subunit [Solirubrobacterales bacterium]
MLSGLESPFHLLIVLVIAMLVLGPKRLPQMARSLGTGIREFKSSISGELSGDQGEEAEKSVSDARLPAPTEAPVSVTDAAAKADITPSASVH